MKRCKCVEKDRNKWVVIVRREKPLSSRLKCLKCSIKWWSKCKYTLLLRDHVEDSQCGLTDQDILDRIIAKTLWVRDDRVFSKSFYGTCELQQIYRTSTGSSYYFVEVRSKGKKKKIAVHRLVWMYHNKMLVPEGYDVDHKLGKNIPNANAIDNLQLLPASVNRSKGKPCDDF